MPSENGPAAPSGPARAAHVAVIFALAAERDGLRESAGHDARVSVYQCGPGLERAAAAANAALAAGADALVSWGFAGGLIRQLEPGDVILPTRVVRAAGGEWPCAPQWHAALAAELGARPVHVGAIVSVARVVATPQDRRAAAQSARAVAVDMESAAIAAAAAEAGVPFAAVRVVVDSSADALPGEVATWIDAAGQPRMLPLLRAAANPSRWPILLTLTQRHRRARRTLADLARQLCANGFCLPQAAAPARRG